MRTAKSVFTLGLGIFLGMLGGTAIAADDTPLVLSANGRQQARVQCDDQDQFIKIIGNRGEENPPISGATSFTLHCMSTDVTLRGAAKTVRFEAHGGVFLLKEGGHGDSFVEVGFAKNRAATQAAQQPAPSSKKKHRKS